jgi:hypothetical protein
VQPHVEQTPGGDRQQDLDQRAVETQDCASQNRVRNAGVALLGNDPARPLGERFVGSGSIRTTTSLFYSLRREMLIDDLRAGHV